MGLVETSGADLDFNRAFVRIYGTESRDGEGDDFSNISKEPITYVRLKDLLK
jgi:hypothetical protein